MYSNLRSGILYAISAYLCWGLFPLYFKALHHVPAYAILPHRMVWSLAFLVIVLAVKRHWCWLPQAWRNRRIVIGSASSAAVLAINWFVFIWAVNAGHVVDASLGYFINPLVNVLVAALFLHENLRPGQWLAIALAGAGVSWLTWQGGSLPWIGLILAFTFAAYGLLRKTAALGTLDGLAMETAILFPFAALTLGYFMSQGEDSFIAADMSTRLLLMASGPITAIPLLLFAAGARRIPFSTLGILQYIGPTGQLLLGVLVFHEPFPAAKLVGYLAIWAALAVYSAEGIWQNRRKARLGTAEVCCK